MKVLSGIKRERCFMLDKTFSIRVTKHRSRKTDYRLERKIEIFRRIINAQTKHTKSQCSQVLLKRRRSRSAACFFRLELYASFYRMQLLLGACNAAWMSERTKAIYGQCFGLENCGVVWHTPNFTYPSSNFYMVRFMIGASGGTQHKNCALHNYTQIY